MAKAPSYDPDDLKVYGAYTIVNAIRFENGAS